MLAMSHMTICERLKFPVKITMSQRLWTEEKERLLISFYSGKLTKLGILPHQMLNKASNVKFYVTMLLRRHRFFSLPLRLQFAVYG